jgi:hypothetical protein
MQKTIVVQNENFSIYEVSKDFLFDIAKFVVRVNYKKHKGYDFITKVSEKEIESVYQEELSFADNSLIYIAENNKQQTIGCIRVIKWDKKSILPIEKIFNMNPLNYISGTSRSSYWHIGRFAVDFCECAASVSLFKRLMMYAIYPICQDYDGHMIAECDSKLLRVMNLLGIDTVNLSNGIEYLGSETIPVYASKKGLNKFYNNHYHLYGINSDSLFQREVI